MVTNESQAQHLVTIQGRTPCTPVTDQSLGLVTNKAVHTLHTPVTDQSPGLDMLVTPAAFCHSLPLLPPSPSVRVTNSAPHHHQHHHTTPTYNCDCDRSSGSRHCRSCCPPPGHPPEPLVCEDRAAPSPEASPRPEPAPTHSRSAE